ncbi:unnamed protein product, partial [Closterium sp. NIES-54]
MAPKARKGDAAAAANGGGDAGDDLMAWVAKSRKLDEKRRAEKEKADRMARMLADQVRLACLRPVYRCVSRLTSAVRLSVVVSLQDATAAEEEEEEEEEDDEEQGGRQRSSRPEVTYLHTPVAPSPSHSYFRVLTRSHSLSHPLPSFSPSPLSPFLPPSVPPPPPPSPPPPSSLCERAGDLAGLRVRHGVGAVLQEGAAVVLTLKDASILAGDDVNEGAAAGRQTPMDESVPMLLLSAPPSISVLAEEDELENVEVAEQSRRDKAYRAAKKTTSIADKFAEDEGEKKPMLPQYDDGQDDE